MGGEGAEALSPAEIIPGPVVRGGAASSFFIEGLSDKRFSDVADLFLAHPSILPADGIPLTFAGKRLFPNELFVDHGPVGSQFYPSIKAILIEIGNNIMMGVDWGQFCGVPAEAFQFIFENQACAWAMIVRYLWRPGYRLVVLMEGPDEFTPTTWHLRDVKPVFGPSRRYAQFLKDAAELDATAAVDAANEILARYVRPIKSTFPRIQHLDEQTEQGIW